MAGSARGSGTLFGQNKRTQSGSTPCLSGLSRRLPCRPVARLVASTQPFLALVVLARQDQPPDFYRQPELVMPNPSKPKTVKQNLHKPDASARPAGPAPERLVSHCCIRVIPIMGAMILPGCWLRHRRCCRSYATCPMARPSTLPMPRSRR